MTKQETIHCIHVMLAYVEGHEIEYRSKMDYRLEGWNVGVPFWDFSSYEYRVKMNEHFNLEHEGCSEYDNQNLSGC